MWVGISIKISKDPTVILNVLRPHGAWDATWIQLVGVWLLVLLRLGVVEYHCIGGVGASNSNTA
jgi:hypothetical protein